MAPMISTCEQVHLNRTATVIDLAFLDERVSLRKLKRSGGLLVLVNDKQVTGRDAQSNLAVSTEAVLLMLVPSIGG